MTFFHAKYFTPDIYLEIHFSSIFIHQIRYRATQFLRIPGHPSLYGPCAVVFPSGQHPNGERQHSMVVGPGGWG